MAIGTRYNSIIIGAGSAGSVLAARLSENPQHHVLLLEAGPGGGHPLIAMPRGWVKMTRHSSRTWAFPVEQEPGRPGPETWTRGRGLGGSSAINGMIYCRGAPQDYDSWANFGISGWGWQDMETVFHALEDRDDIATASPGAPLTITKHPLAEPFAHAVREAAVGLGLPAVNDLNGDTREGFGDYHHTVDRAGCRVSAAKAFLTPARRRPNLTVATGARATRIILEGHRAAGVEVWQNGALRSIRSDGEVFVCCGAIQSPQLLQVSGIGPSALLSRCGVQTVVDLPGVGQNLAEHVVVAMPHRLHGIEGHNRRLHGLGLIGEVLRYYLTGRGLMSFGASEVGGFVRSAADAAFPDLQLSLSPYSFASGLLPGRLHMEREPGVTIIGYMLRPESRGEIAIRSGDIRTPPRIAPHWLTAGDDCRTIVAMVRIMRDFMAQPALRAYAGAELWPGAARQSDDDLLAAIRGNFVCGLHAIGTCRMGTDPQAVLDERLRVHGIAGLRVVDASAIPAPMSGNTNGAVMALAWRAADLILAGR